MYKKKIKKKKKILNIKNSLNKIFPNFLFFLFNLRSIFTIESRFFDPFLKKTICTRFFEILKFQKNF